VLTTTPFFSPINSYLWVQNGQRVTPDSFSNKFETLMGKYCACQIKPCSYRQMAVGIARENILPHLFVEDSTIDESAHHGASIAHTHYGIVEGDLPHLTADSIWRHRTVNAEWHNILGVGMRRPSKPLRFLSKDPYPPSTSSGSRDGTGSQAPSGASSSFSPAGLGGVTPQQLEEALGRISEVLLANVQRALVDEILPAVAEKFGIHRSGCRCPTVADQSGVEVAPRPAQPSSSVTSSFQDHSAFRWTPNAGAAPTSQKTTITSPPPPNEVYSSLPPSSIPTSSSSWSPSSAPIDIYDPPASGASVTEITDTDSTGSQLTTTSSTQAGLPSVTEIKDYSGWSSQQSVLSTGTGSVETTSVHQPWKQVGATAVANQTNGGAATARLHNQDGLLPPPIAKSGASIPHQPLPSRHPHGVGLGPSPSDLKALARRGFCLLFKDPAVAEKSEEQLKYVMACVECQNDVQVILPTGGGKSAGWLVPAVLDRQRVSAIVTPYTLILEDQLRSAIEKGIKAERFTAKGPQLSDDVQLIFVQPESVANPAFRV